VFYTGSSDTHIKKWELSEKIDQMTEPCFDDINLINDFGETHKRSVRVMAIDPQGEYLFTGGDDFNLLKWDTVVNKVLIEIPKAHSDRFQALKITNDSKFLFTGADDCVLKQWSIGDLTIIKNYGKVHSDNIRGIFMTKSIKLLPQNSITTEDSELQETVITISEDKTIKQFVYGEQAKIVYDFGVCHEHPITCAEI